MTLIVDCHTFPCISYLKKAIEVKHIKIEQFENFQKMSFRNRYIIAGANGVVNLTIPVRGGREQKRLLKEVSIDHTTDWPTRHWRSITSAYNKAPFFDYYASGVRSLLFSKENFLFSFNINIVSYLVNELDLNVLVEFTERYVHEYEHDHDYRNYFLPKSFQKNTHDRQPRYSQVFEDRLGFQPNLSVLDLLFCEGPNAKHLLTSSVN